ncbi:MAG: hypothetical protein KME10_00635 [Plectolyngbya sp. WJT66-NPBG17]|nr:hypothetical protein [Plectolyngbya sp. WJT66-NPBG17]
MLLNVRFGTLVILPELRIDRKTLHEIFIYSARRIAELAIDSYSDREFHFSLE